LKGAVVPLSEQDAFLDMLNAFLASPDQYTTALGFQRSKRAACDKVRAHKSRTILVELIKLEIHEN
jgi:hypothetical protein